MRSIARRLGRSPSTISRELSRNADRAGCYRATSVARARLRACEPTEAVKARDQPASCAARWRKISRRRYSPEQIVGRLRHQFPDDPQMRVSPETIYQSLYVQSRGALRRDLTQVPADRAGAAPPVPAGRTNAATGSRT